MASAWRSLEKRLPAISFLLELRDARLPLSGTNPRLHNVAKHGTVVLLTKSDLTSASLVERAVATLARSGTMALPINAHARPAAAANVVVKAIRDLSCSNSSSVASTCWSPVCPTWARARWSMRYALDQLRTRASSCVVSACQCACRRQAGRHAPAVVVSDSGAAANLCGRHARPHAAVQHR
jgi:hypothetical protein